MTQQRKDRGVGRLKRKSSEKMGGSVGKHPARREDLWGKKKPKGKSTHSLHLQSERVKNAIEKIPSSDS